MTYEERIKKENELKDNISTGIKEQLARKQLTQTELADILGIDKSTVGKWINKKALPRMGIIEKLGDYFRVPKSYFLDGVEPIPKSVRIKVYVSIPAGFPIEAIEDICGWEEIPGEWVRGGKDYIALKVKGDSMYPKYLEDDTVIIRMQPDCESGQDCACYVNGYDATLKTVNKGSDSIMLKPINPLYPPKTYAHPGEVKIIGRVVEIRRSV